MSNTPSKAEIEALVKRHGATSYRNRADTQHPAYGFTEDGLNGLIDEVLAKWGTPQPVVREPELDQFLSDVMTAAGLVTHGKQCKQLGERLGAAVMKLRVHSIPQKGCD